MKSIFALVAMTVAAMLAFVTAGPSDVCLIAFQECWFTQRNFCAPWNSEGRSVRIEATPQFNSTHCAHFTCGSTTSYTPRRPHAEEQTDTVYVEKTCQVVNNATIGIEWCAVATSNACPGSGSDCSSPGLLVKVYKPVKGTCNGLPCGKRIENQLTVACDIKDLDVYWGPTA